MKSLMILMILFLLSLSYQANAFYKTN